MSRILAAVLLVCSTVMLSSCESSITRRNDNEDMERAKAYAAGFYGLVQQQRFDEAAKLFGAELPYDDGIAMLNSIKDLRGAIVDAVTDNIGTVVITRNGVITEIECNVELNCVYEKGKTMENLVLKGQNFETLHIVGYQFILK